MRGECADDYTPTVDAEIAYLFRHALLRDAAYGLQLPAARAALHRQALGILEDIFGGLPPEPTTASGPEGGYEPLPIDQIAAELADHAEWAAGAEGPASPELEQRRRVYLKRAAIRAGHEFQNRQSARLWARAAALQQGEARARDLLNASRMESGAGFAGAAEALVRDALKIVDAPDFHGALLPQCLMQLGHLCSTDENLDEAEGHYQRGLQLCERHGHTRLATTLRIRIAFVHSRKLRLDDAAALYTQALHEARQQADLAVEALAVSGLASVVAKQGRHPEADELFERALAMNRQRGDRRAESVTLGNMASYLWDTRQWQRAIDAIRRVLPLHREVGNLRFEAKAMGGLASYALMQDQPEQAMQIVQEALKIDREVGNRVEEGVHLCTVGRCLIVMGRLEEAEQTWRQGIAQLREIKAAGLVEYCINFMRELCTKRGLPPFE